MEAQPVSHLEKCNVALTVGRRYEVLSNALRSPSSDPSRVRGSGYEPGWQIVNVLHIAVKGKDYQIDRERRTGKNKRDHGNGDTSFREGVHSQAGEYLY